MYQPRKKKPQIKTTKPKTLLAAILVAYESLSKLLHRDGFSGVDKVTIPALRIDVDVGKYRSVIQHLLGSVAGCDRRIDGPVLC